ncbi:DUF5011 domain-containing protein [Limosilactobacillus sp. STM2_1]|uniref:DUF5011 domain-containing protein n=1 Tax=Limosilactobacillus rudii TaxID=2759755 RepID=A0A7W3YLL5_9LACO|nr:DUF5011 domain-containing protein [Limosilactobacillus rudii]MBB1078379.1 DUF5011 domain-containing protein [Limosilactobacillus rudii]MBB1096509.1 DUF5011 domain-containing protein [Limosilactobacillus rudii]MCD7134294.1 DUF5011 domain-containing protein [Limosilactobacillus rudii]
MGQPILTVEQHSLIWPLNQPIDQTVLLERLGVHATDDQGQNLTDKVVMNLTQVDVDQVGEYPVMLSVMDRTGQSTQISIMLNVQPQREQERKDAPAGSTKHSKWWLWLIIAVIIIIGIWWGVRAHDQRMANQAATDNQQSSQISNNSSSINKLTKDNQRLANQVAQLKGATQQYQQDHDQQALQNRLDKIENQNQQLQKQVQDNSVKQDLTQVDNTVNEVRQNPDKGTQIVNRLKDQGDFSAIWSSVSQQVQKWLNEFSN